MTAAIAQRRLAAQRLVGAPLPDAPAVVRHLLAVQSQDYAGAKWGLAQRTRSTTDAAVDAQFDAGAFLRLHVMRPTWHLVAPEDLRWLLALTGERVHKASSFQYRLQEIDAALARRAADVFERELAGGGAATREELGRALDAAGIPATGLRLIYLIGHAEVEAILCSGPRRSGKQTYALVAERVPPTPSMERDEALAELARRYVTGHGPAQDVDLAWWSGLTLGDARRALAAAGPALRRESVGERTFWSADEVPPRPGLLAETSVQLLPNYDELLVAFRDRSDALDPELPPPARLAEEILAHAIVRDGRVIGRWQRSLGPGAKVTIEPRIGLDADARGLLGAAVDRYAAFLERPLEVAGLD